MIKNILLISSLGLLFSCNNEDTTTTTEEKNDMKITTVNTLSDEEQKEGWTLLFDGTSTRGWHKYGGEPVGAAWKVKDSTLFLDASEKKDWQSREGGDIVTDEEFSNFHLKLEWKIDTSGNSGIMFNIFEDSVKYEWPWHTGPEIQILDNAAHADAKITKHRAGDLYDLISTSKEVAKPALEWNHAEIRSQNGKLEIFLNGENVVSTTMWDDNWKKMIAGSKFKAMPDFGTFKSGRIGLQDHGNTVWFRNIKIRRL